MDEQMNLDGTTGDPMVNAAKAWALERGLPLWEAGEGVCKSCDDDQGGALYEIATVPGKTNLICWACLPVPGSPLANWESWQPSDNYNGSRCRRCTKRIDGGLYQRGGPFCWGCKSPPEEDLDAWLLKLRENPAEPPPWAGDRAAVAEPTS